MQPSPDMLLQTLLDSGILSDQDVTQLTQSPEGEFDDSDATRVEPTEVLLDRLRDLGFMSDYQLELLERKGPDSLVLGDYVLMDRLGSGGMGEVFRAMHRVMRREVAIKRLKTASIHSPGLTERFLREVRTAAKLIHPNIVTAYDAGEDETGCYLVMEYVEGWDLAELIKQEGPLAVDRAVMYLLQAAWALAHAHEAGIIHRDVKPANFLVNKSGTLKLLDLGLARVEQQIAEAGQSAHLTLTQADQLLGTLGYMAPEQAEDAHHASVAADLYALGCTFYHMLTGRPPFVGRSATKVLIAHRETQPPDLVGVLPPGLNELYQRLLAKDPADRPASAKEVVRWLEEAVASDELAIPAAQPKFKPDAKTKTAPKGKLSSPLLIGLVAAVLLMGGVLYIVITSSGTAGGQATTESVTPAPANPASDTPGEDVNDPPPPPPRDVIGTTTAAVELQKRQAKHNRHPLEYENSIGMLFSYIPAASYRLGSTDAQVDWALKQVLAVGLSERYRPYIVSEKPQRLVAIENPFFMATTEVTVGQFRKFVEATGYKTLPETDGIGGIHFAKNQAGVDVNWDNPGMAQNESHPVINITQPDCIAFCEWLSEKEGLTYRLPIEAEWEFACRAGEPGRWCFGDDQSQFFDYGWSYQNSPNGTQPVAQLKPNAFGMYDMHGNAREWVLVDYGKPTNRFGVGVVRGGSFTKPSVLLRSASRVAFNASGPYPYHSFRVLLEIELNEAEPDAK